MGKHFNAAVRKQFADGIAKRLPQFTPAKVDSRFAWPGERAFVWKHDASNWLWVSVITSPKGYNDFSVELGWSRMGRYPNLDSRPCIAANARVEAVDDAEFMCNLSSVAGGVASWQAPAQLKPAASETEQLVAQSAAHLAALSPEEAETIAQPLVTEALSIIEQHGLAFLERSIISGAASAA